MKLYVCQDGYDYSSSSVRGVFSSYSAAHRFLKGLGYLRDTDNDMAYSSSGYTPYDRFMGDYATITIMELDDNSYTNLHSNV